MSDDPAGPTSASDALRALLRPADDTVRRTRLPDVVADEVAADIFEQGRLPGDPLPTEADMLQRFDIARATLREALRILETRGIVHMRTGRGRGPVVAAPSLRAVVDALTVNFRFLKISLDEVLATRDAIEPILAAEAARNRTADDVAALRELHDAMTVADRSSPRMTQLNRELHTALAVASRNRPLTMLWSAISAVADGQSTGVRLTGPMWEAGLAAHERIIGAVASGDAPDAERCMRAHVTAFHDAVRSLVPDGVGHPAYPPHG